jgi:hypothetical protein
LVRKFSKWHADNFIHIASLSKSLMHPIIRLRLETHVAVIRLKELPSGFRVLSTEAALIENLLDERKNPIRANILDLHINMPDNECLCVALYEVEAIDSSRCAAVIKGYSFGTYSNLAAIQKKASVENGRQADLIKMLNKEL